MKLLSLFKNNQNIDKDFLKMLGHARNYFSANIATKALSLISIPLLIRFLSVEEYGIINVFNTYISFFLCILTLNLFSAVSRYYYENKTDFNSFFTTTVLMTIVVFTIGIVIIYIKIDFFASKLKVTHILLFLLLPILLSQIFSSLYGQIYEAKQESKRIAIRNIIQTYVSFIVSIIFIIFLEHDKYLGYYYGMSIISVFFVVYYFVDFQKYFNFDIKPSHVIYIVKFSVPLIPYVLSSTILSQFGRIVIGNEYGMGSAGVYSFANNVGALLQLFYTALFSAWIPDYFRNKKNNNDLNIKNIQRIYLLILIVGLGLILFGTEITKILANQEFYSAISLIPLFVIGYIFYAIFSVYNLDIAFSHKTLYSSVVVLISGMLSVLLNVLLIKKYGEVGGAISNLLSYVALSALSVFVSKRILNIQNVSFYIFIVQILPLAIISYFMKFILNIENAYFSFSIRFILFLFGTILLIALHKAINSIHMKRLNE